MKRKFLAKILAASLVITAAPGIDINAGAEELSRMSQKTGGGYLGSAASNRKAGTEIKGIEPELDCEGWWTAHTKGIEITEGGAEITFKGTTNSGATGNWNTPSVVIYSNKTNTVPVPVESGTPDYKEYAVVRSDNYATGVNCNTLPNEFENGKLNEWNEAGYTFTGATFPESFEWAEWLAENKNGVDCKVIAVKENGKISIKFTIVIQ